MSLVLAVPARNTSIATAHFRPLSNNSPDDDQIGKPVVRVVAAALFDATGRVLIAERPPGKHMAGRWEFPGGKIAAAETEHQALVRELREELDITVITCRPF